MSSLDDKDDLALALCRYCKKQVVGIEGEDIKARMLYHMHNCGPASMSTTDSGAQTEQPSLLRLLEMIIKVLAEPVRVDKLYAGVEIINRLREELVRCDTMQPFTPVLAAVCNIAVKHSRYVPDNVLVLFFSDGSISIVEVNA